MVAGAGPSGATYAILEVHGLSAEILASMAQEGLITATTEMVQAGNRMVAVATHQDYGRWEAGDRTQSMSRRFPPPWRVIEFPGGFAVDDANGQRLAWFYGRLDPDKARQAQALTMDEARQIATIFARLPELLRWEE
jgi:hypothetical protein